VAIKTPVILSLIGALIGITIADLVVPPALAWYTSPGGLPQGSGIQAVVQIPEVIRYATSRLIWWQLIAGIVGAAIGLTLGIVMSMRSHGLFDGSSVAAP
jgi:hypothetical protein